MIADMTRIDRIAWFNSHIDAIARERAIFEAAVERYGRAIERADAHEHASFSAERFRESIMERADSKLAQEVQEHLGV